MLGTQLNSGHDYTLIKPVVGIHLLDFDLFTVQEQQTQALWRFEMRDERQPNVRLGREMQLNLIELPKADRLRLTLEDLFAWVTFFEHWQEENTMSEIHYPPVQKALDCIKSLSADAETRRLALVRERALGDEAALLRYEREAGRQEGKAEGRLEGLEEAVNRLVQSGMSEDQARRLLGHELGATPRSPDGA
jgi:predicted transposase/invertase (TIGR01784 family)